MSYSTHPPSQKWQKNEKEKKEFFFRNLSKVEVLDKVQFWQEWTVKLTSEGFKLIFCQETLILYS